jgi:hypothetical protein
MMEQTVEAEPVRIHARWQGRPLPGWLGVLAGFLGGLTFLTAVVVGFFVVSAWSLVWSAVIWALWPVVFSKELTTFVFGEPQAAYWKIFLIVAVLQLILKTNTRTR